MGFLKWLPKLVPLMFEGVALIREIVGLIKEARKFFKDKLGDPPKKYIPELRAGFKKLNQCEDNEICKDVQRKIGDMVSRVNND